MYKTMIQYRVTIGVQILSKTHIILSSNRKGVDSRTMVRDFVHHFKGQKKSHTNSSSFCILQSFVRIMLIIL